MYQDLREKLDQALRANKGRIPDNHPIWGSVNGWLVTLGKEKNKNRQTAGFPQAMDAHRAAEMVIQQIKPLCSKRQLSTADEILKKAKTLLYALLCPSMQVLRQAVLTKWQELEDRIAQIETLLRQAAKANQRLFPVAQQSWRDLESCYDDASRKLGYYLFVKGLTYVRAQGSSLGLAQVGDAVSQTLKIVWGHHKHGQVVGDAEHLVNLAVSVLLKILT